MVVGRKGGEILKFLGREGGSSDSMATRISEPQCVAKNW